MIKFPSEEFIQKKSFKWIQNGFYLKDFLKEYNAEILRLNVPEKPRLRYVDKDGMPTEEDGWCICVFNHLYGNKTVGCYHMEMLSETRTDIKNNLIAWLPESEFLAAFVELPKKDGEW